MGDLIEKWTIKEGSLNDLEKYGWTCDIIQKGVKKEVVNVWGKTQEECLSRAKKICKVNEMEAALKAVKSDHNILGEITWHTIENVESLLKDLK